MGPYWREGGSPKPEATAFPSNLSYRWGPSCSCSGHSAFSRDPNSKGPKLKLQGCQQLGPLTQDSHSKQQGLIFQVFHAKVDVTSHWSGSFKLGCPCLTTSLVFSYILVLTAKRLVGSRLAFLPVSQICRSHHSYFFSSLNLIWLGILKLQDIWVIHILEFKTALFLICSDESVFSCRGSRVLRELELMSFSNFKNNIATWETGKH